MNPKSYTICSLALNNPLQALLILAPFTLDTNEDLSTCFIEFANKIYQIYQKEPSIQYLNLSNFPSLQEGTTSKPILLSPLIAELFASSTLLNYGVDGCIRYIHSNTELLPIVKIVLPRQISRARIQYEIEILKEIKRYRIPIPAFDPILLVDTEGDVFGYRIEKLFSLDFKNLGAIAKELREIVDRLYKCSFSYRDLNPSNIIRDRRGRLVLIDPSFSRKIREDIPSYVPSQQYKGSMFSTTTNDKYLKQFFS